MRACGTDDHHLNRSGLLAESTGEGHHSTSAHLFECFFLTDLNFSAKEKSFVTILLSKCNFHFRFFGFFFVLSTDQSYIIIFRNGNFFDSNSLLDVVLNVCKLNFNHATQLNVFNYSS
jgi:hypothetical protein